jgi:hypothetical protein
MVAAAESAGNAPPGGPPSTSFSTSVVDATGPTGNVPQGVRHRRLLQPQWWTLPGPPTAPPGGLPLTPSSTSVVDAVGPTDNAPRGPAIDVFFNLSGGHYRTRRQYPQGGPTSTSTSTASTSYNKWYPLPVSTANAFQGALVNYHYWACYKQGISRGIFFGSL